MHNIRKRSFPYLILVATLGLGIVIPVSQRKELVFKRSDHRPKIINSVQFSSVAQSCPTLCDPLDYKMPGFPVLHSLPEFAQTHVH